MALKINKEDFEVTKENGVAVVKSANARLYLDNSPIDEKVLKEVAKYNSEYIYANVEAAKDISKDIMAEDKDIKKVLFESPYGTSARSKIDVGIERSHTYPGVGDRPEVTKSTIKVNVVEATNKFSPTTRKKWEQELTDALL